MQRLRDREAHVGVDEGFLVRSEWCGTGLVVTGAENDQESEAEARRGPVAAAPTAIGFMAQVTSYQPVVSLAWAGLTLAGTAEVGLVYAMVLRLRELRSR